MYLGVNPYRDLLEGMSVALQINEGIIKLSGRDGVGKSAACRQLATLLQKHDQQVLYFAEAPASVSAMQDAILEQLGLQSQGNFTKLLNAQLLLARRPLHVIFDNAEQIDVQTFDAIRMLCNIQDERQTLVKPVICGSSALETKLADISLRSLAQYLSQSFTLSPMTIEQLKDFYWAYWNERGLQVQPPSTTVITNIFRESQGFPGAVLQRLDLAYQRVIDRREGREPDEPIVQQVPVKTRSRKPWLAAGVGAVLLGSGAVLYFRDSGPAAELQGPLTAGTPVSEAALQDSQSEPLPESVPESLPSTNAAAAVDAEPEAPATELLASEEAAGEAAVPAAAPTPEPVSEPDSEAAVSALLDAWTTAWQAKDIDAYFSHYAPGFEPANGASLADWQQQRRSSIGRASDILISLDSVELQAEDADSITLQFWLHYSASNYADDTLKELLLLKTDAGLRIGSERNLLVERPQ